jgi:GTP-binding protein
VIVAANKVEGRAGEAGMFEAYALGLGDVIGISAEHGEGMGDLYAALLPYAERFAEEASGEVFEPDAEADALAENRPLQIAIVGRPNAGKSTLVNAILGEDRMLTGPEAGITRDAIAVTCDWGGRAFRIFDTAGLRKKAKVQDKVEKLSTGDATRAIRFAEVVVVMMDFDAAFETQDLRIADLAEREGRAVVIAISKWDLVEDKNARSRELRETFERMLPQLKGAPVVPVSALTGRGMDRLREAIVEMHRVWNTRVTTAKLNQWLIEVVDQHPPPAAAGRRLKLRFITQVKARPPSFVAWCSRPESLPESYVRYLVNGLRQAFGLKGVPIRLALRKGENPYVKKR